MQLFAIYVLLHRSFALGKGAIKRVRATAVVVRTRV
jgi:hypothetical protein